jgi:hypothetical protein
MGNACQCLAGGRARAVCLAGQRRAGPHRLAGPRAQPPARRRPPARRLAADQLRLRAHLPRRFRVLPQLRQALATPSRHAFAPARLVGPGRRCHAAASCAAWLAGHVVAARRQPGRTSGRAAPRPLRPEHADAAQRLLRVRRRPLRLSRTAPAGAGAHPRRAAVLGPGGRPVARDGAGRRRGQPGLHRLQLCMAAGAGAAPRRSRHRADQRGPATPVDQSWFRSSTCSPDQGSSSTGWPRRNRKLAKPRRAPSIGAVSGRSLPSSRKE